MILIYGSKLGSKIVRMSALISILSLCMVSAVPVFAEDVPAGACQASNSLSVLVRGKSVVAYVPKGAWVWPVNNVGVVNIEGNSIKPQQITTPNPVNACASNSATGQTVCTANNTDVYLISGTSLQSTLKSGGSGMAMYLEGNCTNCGVTMDPFSNRAVIGLTLSQFPPVAGYQMLNLGPSPKFEAPFASQAPNVDGTGQQISGGILIDPMRNLILSPNEHGNYEIVKLANNNNNDDKKGDDKDDDKNKKDKDKENGNANKPRPAFFENVFPNFPAFGSAAADCTGGTIMATLTQQDPSKIYIADLSKVRTTPGSPAGTWQASPQNSQIQTLTESHLSNGANGIAIVQNTNTGILTGEFGFDAFGGNITAIDLSKKSGKGDDKDGKGNDDKDGKGKDDNKDGKDGKDNNKDGKDNGDGPPEIGDWLTCSIPGGFVTGFAPHTVAAYRSPLTGHSMALVANWSGDPAHTVAVIDLTMMLDKDIVPRTKGKGLGHACASGFLPTTGRNAVVRLVPVP